jgi:hypothetical protein
MAMGSVMMHSEINGQPWQGDKAGDLKSKILR